MNNGVHLRSHWACISAQGRLHLAGHGTRRRLRRERARERRGSGREGSSLGACRLGRRRGRRVPGSCESLARALRSGGRGASGSRRLGLLCRAAGGGIGGIRLELCGWGLLGNAASRFKSDGNRWKGGRCCFALGRVLPAMVNSHKTVRRIPRSRVPEVLMIPVVLVVLVTERRRASGFRAPHPSQRSTAPCSNDKLGREPASHVALATCEVPEAKVVSIGGELHSNERLWRGVRGRPCFHRMFRSSRSGRWQPRGLASWTP